MKNRLSNLNDTLNTSTYSTDLPLALPPAHVTIVRWFDSIVNEGKIKPRKCTVFGKELLYLFYGGVFFRPDNHPTKNASELPIAFLFSPDTLNSFNCYYPFDTGAIAKGRFGKWTDRLENFKEQYKVLGANDYKTPCKIVQRLYKTNADYLQGVVNPELRKDVPPLPLLYEFISHDFTQEGIDHRQCIIECQSEIALNLDQQLLWIGFPECMTNEFIRLFERTQPYIPDYYTYKPHAIFNPSEIAAQLQLQAYNIIKRFEKLPGTINGRI